MPLPGNAIKVVTATTSRYPDGLVICTRGPNESTLVADPVVVFEILSRSGANTDHITKNREYGATVFARTGAEWLGHVPADGGVLAMPEIAIALPLAELCDGLDVTAAPEFSSP